MWPFGKGSKSPNKKHRDDQSTWKALEKEEQLTTIVESSKKHTVVIFKHSSRCSLSAMAKFRLERGWDFDRSEVELYFLDLLRFRSVSNKIEEVFGVLHQSPQILLIRNGHVTYDASHGNVTISAIRSNLK